MKTLQEAMEEVLICRARTTQEAIAGIPALNDRAAKFKATMDEVANDQTAQIACLAMMEHGAAKDFTDIQVVVMAFCHGVMVGIAMERNELE